MKPKLHIRTKFNDQSGLGFSASYNLFAGMLDSVLFKGCTVYDRQQKSDSGCKFHATCLFNQYMYHCFIQVTRP